MATGNIARNDITGKVIKSNPQTKAYADGWDRVFAKKPAHEWLKEENIELLDPDGWRQDDGVDLDTPIKWSDFQQRLSKSTVIFNPNDTATKSPDTASNTEG